MTGAALLKQAEEAFEFIRLKLVSHLYEPERSAFWKAVEARDAIRQHTAAQAAGTWRTDMENAPKDRPFLAYWHMSDIFGVLEWIDNRWIDQDGDEVMAFRQWSLFDLPERRASSVPSAKPCAYCGCTYGHCLTSESAKDCRTSSVPSASRGTEA